MPESKDVTKEQINAFVKAAEARIKEGWLDGEGIEERFDQEVELIKPALKAACCNLTSSIIIIEATLGTSKVLDASLDTIKLACKLMFQAGLEAGRLNAVSLTINDPAKVQHMMLCESRRLKLKPDQLYVFHACEDCDECQALVDESHLPEEKR